MNSYLTGQAEAQLDIVPGLMPASYVLGRLDAKAKKHPDKNKPGFDWVEDPGVKGGGYYRKAKNVGGNAAKIAAAAVLVGAGAAAIASGTAQRAIAAHKSSTKPSSALTLPVAPPPKTAINKKAVAAVGVGALSVAGAVAAGARKTTSQKQTAAPEEKMPKNAKVEYKQVSDPWSGHPQAGATQAATSQTSEPPTNSSPTQLPPAKYQSRYPNEGDPWEGKSSEEATKPPLSSISNETPNTPQLPPAKPVTYKRQLVPKSPKLRQQINLAKREQTGLKKAQESLELGRYLKTKTHSPADVMRGTDVEMNAQERIANLKAKLPERTPAGLATIRGKNKNSVRAGETAEESNARKKKEQKNSGTLTSVTVQPDNIPVTPTSKASDKTSETPLSTKKGVLETGELPSRGEIVKAAGQSAVEKAKSFGRMVKEKGLKGAVLQSAQNASERRLQLAKKTAAVGVNLPEAYENTRKAGIQKVTKAAKKLAIEEGPPLIGGTVGGMIGNAIGGYPGYLAGDLLGAKTVRKAQIDIEATRKAQQKLSTNVNYRSASKFEKIKMLGAASAAELKSPEMQAKIAQKNKEDVVGWAIGNTLGKAGYNFLVAGGLAAGSTNSIIAGAEQAAKAVKNRGVIGASSYLLKSAATAPQRAVSAIKAGNEREAELRKNIKKAIQASKSVRKINGDSAHIVATGIIAVEEHHQGRADSKAEKLMHKVMSQYKKRKLHIGRSKQKVQNRSQAIAIGLSVSGMGQR